MKSISFNKYQYNLIMNNMPFNIRKQERIIFEMDNKGFTIKEIADQLNVSKRTISYRKKELLKKINFYLSEKELLQETYCVYIHIFPNNKVYIGMTSDIKRRWDNGLGYQENENMFNDILKYGWDNIEHKILKDNLSYAEAIKLENEKIIEYNSYNKKCGYNVKVMKD